MSRLLATAALLATGSIAPPPALGAQIFKLPKKSQLEPAYWFGANVGYHDQQSVLDGGTGTEWAFGGTVQYRVFAEYALGRGSSVGVAASYARMPLAYETFDGSPAVTGGGARVDAHADVTALLATFHTGGREGFHYVLDAGLGVTNFANFRADQGGVKLAPRSDTDVSFTIGSGIGYSTSPRTEFFLVQEYGSVFHQRVNLPNDVRAQSQQLTTRLGARFGAGARRLR